MWKIIRPDMENHLLFNLRVGELELLSFYISPYAYIHIYKENFLLNTYLSRSGTFSAARPEERGVLDACRRTRAGCRASWGTRRTCEEPSAPWQPQFRPRPRSGRWRILPRKFRRVEAYPFPRESPFQVGRKDLGSRWRLPCSTCHRKSLCPDLPRVPGTY